MFTSDGVGGVWLDSGPLKRELDKFDKCLLISMRISVPILLPKRGMRAVSEIPHVVESFSLIRMALPTITADLAYLYWKSGLAIYPHGTVACTRIKTAR